jgi:hypothetical protein
MVKLFCFRCCSICYMLTKNEYVKHIYVDSDWNYEIWYTNPTIFPQFLAYSFRIKLNPKSEICLCVWCMRTDKLWINNIFLCGIIWPIATCEELLDAGHIQLLDYKNIQHSIIYGSTYFRLKSVTICTCNLLRVVILTVFVTQVKRAWNSYSYRRSHRVSALPRLYEWNKDSFL